MNESKLESSMPAIHRAAIEGDLTSVYHLLGLEGVGCARQINNELEYPLYSALFLPAVNSLILKTKKEEIFRALLEYSADLLVHQNRDGDTVLHRLARNGFENLVDDILTFEGGSELLSIKNAKGSYPIHVAVLNGQLDVVKQLFSHQGISEKLDSDGNSPLHLAASYGSTEMLETCLAHSRESINTQNAHGETPLDLALVNNSPEVQAYLTKHGAISNPARDELNTYVSSCF